MKKFLRATALLLAVSVTLTGCSDIVYQTAEVTQVDELTFTVNETEGIYTGDWKGNRPEGSGKLVVSDNEYYSGEWTNGVLSGQGEMRKTDEDNITRYYKGEVVDNQPGGAGQMTVSADGDTSRIEVYGDFSDESTLVWYEIDEKGKLLDIGGIADSVYISYVDYPNYEGIKYINYVTPDDQAWLDQVSHKWELVSGKYVGQTDENGLPDGYGCYVSFWNWIGHDALVDVDETRQKRIYGSWKNGEPEGYITERFDEHTTYKQDNSIFVVWERKDECFKDGKLTGDYVETHQEIASDGSTYTRIDKYNIEDMETYTLDATGQYRTGYKVHEGYSNTGNDRRFPAGTYYAYEKLRYCKTKQQYEADDGSRTYDGEYGYYDKDGNVIDYGVANTYCDYVQWLSYMKTPPKKTEKSENLLGTVVTVGTVMLIAYMGYKGLAAAAETERDWNANSNMCSDMKKSADELMKRAANESPGERQDALMKEAQELYKNSNKYKWSVF